MGVGGRGVNPPCSACGEHSGLGFHIDGFAGFHADGDHAHHGPVLVLDQVGGIPLIEEHRVVLDIALIEGVQQGMPRAVGCGTGPGSLGRIVGALRLAAERTLVDTPFLGAGKRQPHVFQLEHRFRADAAHVLDSVLVADIIGALDRVIHVPAPIVIGVGAGNGAGDAALSRHRV